MDISKYIEKNKLLSMFSVIILGAIPFIPWFTQTASLGKGIQGLAVEGGLFFSFGLLGTLIILGLQVVNPSISKLLLKNICDFFFVGYAFGFLFCLMVVIIGSIGVNITPVYYASLGGLISVYLIYKKQFGYLDIRLPGLKLNKSLMIGIVLILLAFISYLANQNSIKAQKAIMDNFISAYNSGNFDQISKYIVEPRNAREDLEEYHRQFGNIASYSSVRSRSSLKQSDQLEYYSYLSVTYVIKYENGMYNYFVVMTKKTRDSSSWLLTGITITSKLPTNNY